eukprot:SAG31_NODE_1956_length_6817_cov_10.363501_6_plen_71_part_00
MQESQLDPVAVEAMRDLSVRLADPYKHFGDREGTVGAKQECKEHFEALTKLLEEKPNRDYWVNKFNGLAL